MMMYGQIIFYACHVSLKMKGVDCRDVLCLCVLLNRCETFNGGVGYIVGIQWFYIHADLL